MLPLVVIKEKIFNQRYTQEKLRSSEVDT